MLFKILLLVFLNNFIFSQSYIDNLVSHYKSIESYIIEFDYITKRNNDGWGRLTNIGSSVNSEYQDISPFLLNNDTLTFISNRVQLGYELFFTSLKDGNWS